MVMGDPKKAGPIIEFLHRTAAGVPSHETLGPVETENLAPLLVPAVVTPIHPCHGRQCGLNPDRNCHMKTLQKLKPNSPAEKKASKGCLGSFRKGEDLKQMRLCAYIYLNTYAYVDGGHM